MMAVWAERAVNFRHGWSMELGGSGEFKSQSWSGSNLT